MPVEFSHEQYETLRNTYRKWWTGELDRPIVPIITNGYSNDASKSNGPELLCANSWDFTIDPRRYIDTADVKFSTQRWHGDAFPCFRSTNAFGPGCLAAFLGCTPINHTRTVWFEPPRKDIPIEELHFEFDENNKYYRRVLNFYEAAMEKWRGSVVVSMLDLGGILDVLSIYRGAENLLMDLYDDPDNVIRCVKELQEMWFLYYNKISAIMEHEAEGYSDWFGMYSAKPSYILQSDFSYMISPNMFNTFVAPELASSASKLHNALYHMDGIGEIPHLDSILSIDGIKAVQWVPGAGTPSTQNWDELLTRILDSGKKLLSLTQQADGSHISIAKNPGQLYFYPRDWHVDNINDARKYGDMYGIEL